MVYIKDKYVYHHTNKRRKSGVFKILILSLFGVILVVGILFLVTGIANNRKWNMRKQESQISGYWNEKNYGQVIEQCDVLLKEKPLDSRLLAYKGFANFYKAESEIENKSFYYDAAVVALRKAMIPKTVIFEKEIYFILGMTYFYKGKYYNELAVKYLEKAIEAGYASSDALIRLGMVYGSLGEVDKELKYLLEALSENSSDSLFLLIGKAYFKLSQFDKAEEYLIRYINRTDDPKTEQEARFRLGEIYFGRKDYIKAEDQYKEILKLDNQSASAHFNLGEIYFKLNDIVKARAEWRQTLRIDPSHHGARLRYYN